MLEKVPYNRYLPELTTQLPRGAFLTTKWQNELNTMTIGWGSVGVVWSRPVFTVLVRYSRHTYSLLEKAQEFTVSVPLAVDLRDALQICGTRSGRDIDKFSVCKLTARPGVTVSTPVVGECELHYECKVIYQQAMEPALVAEKIANRYYRELDYHIIYYGEIQECYKTT
ncbi:MAG: flavin reductase family protein [Firmicutes bacterium]|nr:flavin reductase family protein [Bacillota bacterium]